MIGWALVSALLAGCGQQQKAAREATASTDSTIDRPEQAAMLSAVEQDSLLYQAFKDLFPQVNLPIVLTNAGL